MLHTNKMKKRIRDIISNQSRSPSVNRDALLAMIATCLQDTGPIVVWLHGPTGAGKSELLDAFEHSAEANKATFFRIDCRTVEPTVPGVFDEIGKLIGTRINNLEHAVSALSESGTRIVIAFDNYEVFRLADSWLRREFIPALTETVRILLISSEPPTAGWISATEWWEYFLTVSLDGPAERSREHIMQSYLAQVQQSEIRNALEAVSVVRRITRPMLASLCPEIPTSELYESLANLSFVESRRDGLAIEDSIRKVISNHLQAADIERYRHYQQEAWKLLRQQLKESARTDLWRSTADVIYLIENPVIREAFFPSESANFSVEAATPVNKQDILEIAGRHEPPAAIEALQLWWYHLPSAFQVIRDTTGTIVGFYCVAKPDDLDSSWMHSDPVVRNWQFHLNLKGRSARKPALFLRRWLSRDEGEAPSAVQAAAWIDIKRTYLELRPALRLVYLALQDIGPYGPVATRLGFTVLEELTASLNDTQYYTAMLDFGPGSVDGWICNLLAVELGITDDRLLDVAARELVLNGSRIPLTPLEFSLVSMLESRMGEAVPRSELLRQVWGHSYKGGSNVVDAMVRGLRKKCGEDADILETVRGVGYRLRA